MSIVNNKKSYLTKSHSQFEPQVFVGFMIQRCISSQTSVNHCLGYITRRLVGDFEVNVYSLQVGMWFEVPPSYHSKFNWSYLRKTHRQTGHSLIFWTQTVDKRWTQPIWITHSFLFLPSRCIQMSEEWIWLRSRIAKNSPASQQKEYRFEKLPQCKFLKPKNFLCLLYTV